VKKNYIYFSAKSLYTSYSFKAQSTMRIYYASWSRSKSDLMNCRANAVSVSPQMRVSQNLFVKTYLQYPFQVCNLQ